MCTNEVACTTSYDCVDFIASEYSMHPVRVLPVMVYMGCNNPLASKSCILPTILRCESLLAISPKSPLGHKPCLDGLLACHGITPVAVIYAHDYGEHIGNLLLDKRLLIASGNFLENAIEEQITRIPLKTSTSASASSEMTAITIQRFAPLCKNQF